MLAQSRKSRLAWVRLVRLLVFCKSPPECRALVALLMLYGWRLIRFVLALAAGPQARFTVLVQAKAAWLNVLTMRSKEAC